MKVDIRAGRIIEIVPETEVEADYLRNCAKNLKYLNVNVTTHDHDMFDKFEFNLSPNKEL